MASFSELMRILPRIALNILPGVMMGGGAASRILQRAVDKRIPGAALTYGQEPLARDCTKKATLNERGSRISGNYLAIV